jgi:hypothetical protein
MMVDFPLLSNPTTKHLFCFEGDPPIVGCSNCDERKEKEKETEGCGAGTRLGWEARDGAEGCAAVDSAQ